MPVQVAACNSFSRRSKTQRTESHSEANMRNSRCPCSLLLVSLLITLSPIIAEADVISLTPDTFGDKVCLETNIYFLPILWVSLFEKLKQWLRMFQCSIWLFIKLILRFRCIHKGFLLFLICCFFFLLVFKSLSRTLFKLLCFSVYSMHDVVIRGH